jgi:hypothetical protein
VYVHGEYNFKKIDPTGLFVSLVCVLASLCPRIISV